MFTLKHKQSHLYYPIKQIQIDSSRFSLRVSVDMISYVCFLLANSSLSFYKLTRLMWVFFQLFS